MGAPIPAVCIVDDDADIRDVLARLVRTLGMNPEVYGSAEAFLRREVGSEIACLLLDIELGGMNGLSLLERLADERQAYPVFLMSGQHDAQSRSVAMRLGAMVVEKPFDARRLGRSILAAVGAGSG